MFKKDGQPIALVTGMVLQVQSKDVNGKDIDEDVQIVLPLNAEQMAQFGITEEPDQPRPDDRFYLVGEQRPDGTYPAKPKDLDDLKAGMVGQVKATAGSLLMPTSWMIERAVDPSSGKPVPQDVLDYRAAVREASNANEAAVMAAANVDELAALVFTWPEQTA